MAREAKSHVRKRRRGCISGCLTNILLLLGLAALLFVGACVLGFVKNDPETGAPSLSLDGVTGLSNLHLPDVSLPENLPDVTLPSWAYGVSKTGLTVKTLRAGDGEAVLVCADGYTMLLGGGSGMGVTLTGQLLLCGVSHLNAAVAMSSQQSQIGGLPLAITLVAALLWSLSAQLMPALIVSYRLRFTGVVRNAVLMTLAALPKAIAVKLATLAIPVVLLLLMQFAPPAMRWAVPAALVLYAVFWLSFNRLITASYANACCEKYLNPKIEGAGVDIGLRRTEHGEESKK